MPGAPEPLALHHIVTGFESGVETLDAWLKRRAMANQVSGASRTFVVGEKTQGVGYYALAFSAIAPAATPGHLRRNMPDPTPPVVLGRLAVARTHHGKGLGRALFQDVAANPNLFCFSRSEDAFSSCSVFFQR